MQHSMGNLNEMRPPYMVASQLKILIPVGTAIKSVEATKKVLSADPMPTVNMWCAQAPVPMMPMVTVAATIIGYPNSTLRENTGIISDA
jgi:hypothetical protein